MGGAERNKFCTDGRMAFRGREKKLRRVSKGTLFFFFRANLSGRTSAARWAALLLPSTATRATTAGGSLLQPQANDRVGAVPAA